MLVIQGYVSDNKILAHASSLAAVATICLKQKPQETYALARQSCDSASLQVRRPISRGASSLCSSSTMHGLPAAFSSGTLGHSYKRTRV